MRHKRDKADKNKVTKVLHSISPNKYVFRHKMAHEIEKKQKKFNDVVEDISGLNLNPNVVVVEKTNDVWRETGSFVLESDIIGREDDKKDIISLLKQSDENQYVSLVAIVGIGGMGKTTLAQLVYNDGEVQDLFEERMWVCVSENFEVKTILKNMLESLTKNKIDDTLSLDNLQNTLRDNLTGKRYLLVLDDIWNESFEKWAQFRTYLMCGAQGSKILVTTRSKIVAQTMNVSDPYVLNGLTLEESWGLLHKVTFGDDTIEVNRTLESIGKKISEKCRGVPLAIRSLGGILQSEEREWIDVLRGDFWKLCEDKESIMPVLKLSYENLSPVHRQCFAFCSLYPKGWAFDKAELVQMWMAQGYLECSIEEKCMEDLGNQFVNILLMKSFFQDAIVDQDGDILVFKMHDLMHDLATQVSGNDCCCLDSKAKRCAGRPVHVSVELDTFCIISSHHLNSINPSFLVYLYWKLECPMLTCMPTFPNIKKRLSLTECSMETLEATLNIEASQYSIDFPPLSMLKSLQISETGLDVKKVPKDWLQNLTSLKNLNLYHLSNQEFEEIEIWFKDELNCLPSLQTITFFDCYHLEALPDWICNISSLQHIQMNYCKALAFLPDGMPRLSNLHTLEIYGCPLLAEECRMKTSSTWLKIAHIPNIITFGWD